MRAGDLQGAFVQLKAFEGDGDGADASLDAGREELGENIKEKPGVVEAVGLGPIGHVDLLFHPGAMKLAERKSIDGEDIAVLVIEPATEGGETVGVLELTGGAGGEAETDGERLTTSDAIPDGEGVVSQGTEDFVPRLATVNVGAIGEVPSVAELHGREVWELWRRGAMGMVRPCSSRFGSREGEVTRIATMNRPARKTASGPHPGFLPGGEGECETPVS